jgi:hypothetical protein
MLTSRGSYFFFDTIVKIKKGVSHVGGRAEKSAGLLMDVLW